VNKTTNAKIYNAKLILLLLMLLPGCVMFDCVEKHLASHQLRDGRTIQLYIVGCGATTSDIIWVNQRRPGSRDTIINEIEPFDNHVIQFHQLSDSILKLVFIDTILFKGDTAERIINLNERLEHPPTFGFQH
jgi:hypothetical protein